MSMQLEQDSCIGRGFGDTDANGWCEKFKLWVTRSPVQGGPGWYIIRDRSTAPVARTITAVNTTTEILTIPGHGFLNGEPIRFQTTGTQIGGITTGTKYYCKVLDADNIQVFPSWDNWLRNTSVMNLTSAGSGNSAIVTGPYIVISDQANPSAISNAKIAKIGYDSGMAGYAMVQFFLTAGSNANTHPLGLWGGYPIKTVDSGAFTYNFRGNDEFILWQSRIPVEAKWYRAGIDEWSILNDFTEDDATVHGIVASNQTFTAGQACTLTLQSEAQVNSLTKGNGYFIYYAGLDINGSADTCYITYGVINGKGVSDGLTSTQVRFELLPGLRAISNTIQAGARITPYLHTVYAFSNAPTETFNSSLYNDLCYAYMSSSYYSFIPYMSYNIDSSAYCMHQQGGQIGSGCSGSIEDVIVSKGLQDDGNYIVQRPAIIESRNGAQGTSGMNRVWGETKNLYCTISTGMTDMETGRTINALDFVSLGPSSSLLGGISSSTHLLIQQTETL